MPKRVICPEYLYFNRLTFYSSVGVSIAILQSYNRFLKLLPVWATFDAPVSPSPFPKYSFSFRISQFIGEEGQHWCFTETYERLTSLSCQIPESRWHRAKATFDRRIRPVIRLNTFLSRLLPQARPFLSVPRPMVGRT